MFKPQSLRRHRFLIIVAIAVALAASIFWLTGTPRAASEAALDEAERAAVEQTVRDYLRENPEAVIEAIRTYQAQQEALQREQVAASLASQRNALENDPGTPVAGNPDGDVTVVEFFDYRCGYCKRVLPAVQALIAADNGVRYVFKEYPILGPESVTAAKASLAVWKTTPDRYMDFHSALLSTRGSLSESRILKLAEQQGLDADLIESTMAEPWVEEAIKENYQLGRSLQINGTPAFIIGDVVVPGAVGLEELKALVADARSS